MLRRFWVVLSILAVTFLAGTRATAGTIDFAGLGNSGIVTVGGSINSGTFHAGELNWTWEGPAPVGYGPSFYTYCIDLAHFLVSPQTVDIRSTDDLQSYAPSGGAKAAWLLDTFG